MSDKRSAIGILGGSFDPIHNGHLYLADQARAAVPLDRVIFIPAFLPPHKTSRDLTDPAHRLNMIRLALMNREGVDLDEMEIERGGVSYTVDTVEALEKKHPLAELYFIIGSDSLHELWTWRRIRDIAGKVIFLVLRRDEEDLPMTHPNLEKELKGTPLQSIRIPGPPLPVSSTLLRSRIVRGEPFEEFVPPTVAAYIRENDLYRGSQS